MNLMFSNLCLRVKEVNQEYIPKYPLPYAIIRSVVVNKLFHNLLSLHNI